MFWILYKMCLKKARSSGLDISGGYFAMKRQLRYCRFHDERKADDLMPESSVTFLIPKS